MDLKRTINGIIILMICIIQVASQYLPSRQIFKGDVLYDDDYSESNQESYFAPYQRIRQKQKFITATGNNEKTPSEIAFDTYNMFGYPALLKRLSQANKYWPTKSPNQLQHAATNSKGKQFEKSLQEQQSQLSSAFTPIKENGNKFADVLYPIDDTANDAVEDQNVNENSTPTPSSQLPLQVLNEKNQNYDAADNIWDYYLIPEMRRNDVLLEKRTTRNKNKKQQINPLAHGYDKKIQKNSINPLNDERTADDDYLFSKRNAFRAFKRQKARSQQTTFFPSISAGAMTNLGHFFTDLADNVHFVQDRPLKPGEKQLLEGDHPIVMLKEELMRTINGNPNGRFIHAIRTYQPSEKIRSLVAMNPEGYHGSQFLDPNYYYIGLG